VKPWVISAIKDEGQFPADRLWKKEPTAEYVHKERLRRIKFVRKHSTTNPEAQIVADRLESCDPEHRCLSGACPECGKLFQRWFVRRSKKLVAKHIDKQEHELVAISIVPHDPMVQPGQLHTIDIVNLQRRLKYALDAAAVGIALGGIDFSFNQDREGKYQPLWSPHFYLITSAENKKTLRKKLLRIYRKCEEVCRPVKIPSFENIARRRSYAFKMNFGRRIGYDDIKNQNGKVRECRDASQDKLRAAERIELFSYLDKIGFANRVIFRNAQPRVKSDGVTIEKC
jgi:hypothetical protein